MLGVKILELQNYYIENSTSTGIVWVAVLGRGGLRGFSLVQGRGIRPR